jgi:hypothetical protein
MKRCFSLSELHLLNRPTDDSRICLFYYALSIADLTLDVCWLDSLLVDQGPTVIPRCWVCSQDFLDMSVPERR